MITVKSSKEIVVGKEFDNKSCEHCGSRKDVYEVVIDCLTARILKIYLCKECLKELKNKIGAED